MKGRGRDDKCKHDVFKTWLLLFRFKEFVIENNRQKVTSTGRVVNDHKGDGIKTLYGCLADATTETAKNKSTEDHTVTHTIVQRGTPLAKKTDKLVLGNRVLYVVAVDDTGGLGISTLYYVEERDDIKNDTRTGS